ncbi:MAG: glycosyltransferase family 87 protein [Chlorobium sp.]
MSKNMVDLKGKPLGYDFITLWAASHLALEGHAEDAYNIPLLLKALRIAVPGSQSVYIWFYPPSFYLVVLPLALLPYMASFLTFILSTLGAYLLVFRRIVRGSTAMWCLAAFSGLWMNLFNGQNAFLTAALAGVALLCLERRPVLGGLFIGLLAIKPHLALLFPVALIAIGAWRTLITAAVTAITFTAIGTVTLGTAVLKGFLANLSHGRLLLENGTYLWPKMPTMFAFLRLLGIPVAGAYVVHCIVALGAVIVVWRVWRRCQDRNLRGATLMTATFLVSPYLLDYDLAWLAFPIAWLALAGLRNGWQRGEREVLVFAWLLPLLITPIGTFLSVQIGPIVLCSLLWITVRRTTVTSMIGATA